MRLLRKMRKQNAVYWAPLEINTNGEWTYDEPVQLKVRWEDRVEEVKLQASKALVYVDRELVVQGVLWKGKISELEDEDNPFANPGAFAIQTFMMIPTLNNRYTLYLAGL
jgi:hypothetical protein